MTSSASLPSETLYTQCSSCQQCCLDSLKTKLWGFPLPAFPVKRSREEEAHGSGSEPQRKRQKDERKTEPDGSSASPSSHRWKTTLAHTCSCYDEAMTVKLCCTRIQSHRQIKKSFQKPLLLLECPSLNISLWTKSTAGFHCCTITS